jgi:biotin transport system substrate-specific component
VALLGQVAIPLPFTPVPLTLGSFAVLSASAVLGPRRAATAMGLFVAAGLAGAPVFAGQASGVTPTLGYAVGYILAGLVVGRLAGKANFRLGRALAGTLAGSLAIYLVGVPWLALTTGYSLTQAIGIGVLPFLIGDAIKALAVAGMLSAGRATIRLWR